MRLPSKVLRILPRMNSRAELQHTTFFPGTVLIGCPNLPARYISYKVNERAGPAMRSFRTRAKAPTSQEGRATWENVKHRSGTLGKEAEFVTGVTRVVQFIIREKIERLNLFLHCCYSISRGRRVIEIYNKWNFRSTRKTVRRNNEVIKAVPPGCIPLPWSRAPFPALI
jgi:hypothetical protein